MSTPYSVAKGAGRTDIRDLAVIQIKNAIVKPAANPAEAIAARLGEIGFG